MISKRMLFFYILLAFLVIVLQAIPKLLGSAFAFTVILSGLPLYIAARLNCCVGIVIFFTVAALSVLVNIGDALFFICTSGIVGLTLGIMRNCLKHIYIIPLPSALIVLAVLSTINCFCGIRIFGNSELSIPFPKVFTLIPMLYLYCLIYLKLSMLAENLLHRSIELRCF